MSDLLQSIQNMPLAGIVPAFVLLIAGLVLWLAGKRVLRGAFILMGLLIGALIGLLIDIDGQSGMPGWVLPTLCGVGLAMLAAITYRLAAAVMMAIVLALACSLSVIAVNELQVQRGGGLSANGDETITVDDSISDWIDQHDDPAAREKAKAALQDAREQVTTRIDDLATKYGLQDEAAAGIEHARSLGRAIVESIRQRWASTPKRLKPMVSLSAIVGALTGLIIGLLMRRISDCAVTAMVGAAVWLSALHVIAIRLGAPDGPWFPKSTIVWLGVWLAVAVIGLTVQWTRKQGQADKPA